MELETGNDRLNMEMVARQSALRAPGGQRSSPGNGLHFDSLVLRLPCLFNGYCAGSWNNDDSDLTSISITGGPHAIN